MSWACKIPHLLHSYLAAGQYQLSCVSMFCVSSNAVHRWTLASIIEMLWLPIMWWYHIACCPCHACIAHSVAGDVWLVPFCWPHTPPPPDLTTLYFDLFLSRSPPLDRALISKVILNLVTKWLSQADVPIHKLYTFFTKAFANIRYCICMHVTYILACSMCRVHVLECVSALHGRWYVVAGWCVFVMAANLVHVSEGASLLCCWTGWGVRDDTPKLTTR